MCKHITEPDRDKIKKLIVINGLYIPSKNLRRICFEGYIDIYNHGHRSDWNIFSN